MLVSFAALCDRFDVVHNLHWLHNTASLAVLTQWMCLDVGGPHLAPLAVIPALCCAVTTVIIPRMFSMTLAVFAATHELATSCVGAWFEWWLAHSITSSAARPKASTSTVVTPQPDQFCNFSQARSKAMFTARGQICRKQAISILVR